MLNSIEFIITNGCFPVLKPIDRPYTLSRKPNTYTILDYNLIAKHHAPLIGKCQVLQRALPGSVTDHMPIDIHLDLLSSQIPVPEPPLHSPPARTLYHSKRLEDPQAKDTYTCALAKKLPKLNSSSVNFSHNLIRAKHLQNRSLTLQTQQLLKSCNTRHM